MGLTAFIAKMIFLLYISAGAGVLFDAKYYRRNAEKIIEHPGVITCLAFIALILGAVMIRIHNIWVWGWPVAVTLIGWLALVKGVWLFAFPSTLKWFKPMYSPKLFKWMLIPYAVMVLLFGYIAFFATCAAY